MKEEEWLNYKLTEDNIEKMVNYVMQEDDIDEEEAEYLNKKKNNNSNDTISKILNFQMYKIFDERKSLNITRPEEEVDLLDDPDFDEFHDYVEQVI